jgi:hypothetical protein
MLGVQIPSLTPPYFTHKNKNLGDDFMPANSYPKLCYFNQY